MTQSTGDGGKTVRRGQAKATLSAGRAMVQTGNRIGGREMVVIFQAQKVTPGVAAAKSWDVLVGSNPVMKSNQAASAPKAASRPARRLVSVKALIAKVDIAASKTAFNEPVVTEETGLRVVVDRKPFDARISATTYRLAGDLAQATESSSAMLEEAQVLSRPRILTVLDQQGVIEVGREIPLLDQANPGTFRRVTRGIKLTVTPKLLDGRLSLDGELRTHFLGQVPVTQSFSNIAVEANQTLLLEFDPMVGDDLILLYLEPRLFDDALQAGRSSVGQDDERIQGAVVVPGIYQVPAGQDNRTNAITVTGGLAANAGRTVSPADMQTRTMRVYPVGSLVSKSMKSASEAMEDLQQRIRRIVNPESFNNGNTIRINLNAQSLVVRADDRTHEQISELVSWMSRSLDVPHGQSVGLAEADLLVAGGSKIETRVYPVADLVVPMRGEKPDVDPASIAELTARVRAIRPGSWNAAGGDSSVAFTKETLSLVIRAPGATHEKIAALVTELRRREPGQVTLDVALVEWSGSPEFTSSGGAGLTVRSLVIKDTGRPSGPKITVFSGREFRLPNFHHDLPLVCRAKIEGQKVVVTATIAGQVTSWVIPDGYVGVADVTTAVRKALGTKASGRSYRLKIKATIVKCEEEELILDSASNVLMLTPRGIVSEEEEELILGEPSEESINTDRDGKRFYPSGPEFKLSDLEERLEEYRRQQQRDK